MRLLAAILATLLATLLAMAAAAGSAAAHASLVESTPFDGEVLPAPPPRLVLTFTEPVTPLVLRLIGPDGSGRDLAPAVRGNRLEADLPADLARGTSILNWRATSADSRNRRRATAT